MTDLALATKWAMERAEQLLRDFSHSWDWKAGCRNVALALDEARWKGIEDRMARDRMRIDIFAAGAEFAGHSVRAEAARDIIKMLKIVDDVFGEPTDG